MEYLIQNEDVPGPSLLISKYFNGTGPVFETTLKYDNFLWELRILEEAESVLPTSLSFDLHLDMILDQGGQAVTRYYKNLINGKNDVLEKAKTHLRKFDHPRINESSLIFNKKAKKKLTERLNEADSMISLLDPSKSLTDLIKTSVSKEYKKKSGEISPITDGAENTEAEFEIALGGGEYKGTKEDASGVLVKLWNSLTEGNSMIGVIHLLLDILGAFGDFVFLGMGAIFDILNAIIYFIRGKFLLGAISLIAAVVFGAGDTLKLLKPAARSAEPVMMALIKNGGKSGGEALAKLPAKESGPVLNLLRFIAKNIGTALGKATSLLGKFFDQFLSKAVGWLPIIGKPLKSFFDEIGGAFGRYGQDLTKVSKEFGLAEKTAIDISRKESAESLNTLLKTSGQGIIIEPGSKVAKIVDKEGKVIGKEFPVEWVPGYKSKKAILGSEEAIGKYYSGVASSNEKMAEGIGKSLTKMGATAFKRTGQFAFFIGKEIIKLTSGKDWQEAGYKEEEVEYWGNSALTSFINDRIKKEKKDSGATYIPAVDLDSSEEEVFERITKYQNEYAKLFGQPQIIPVIYDKYGDTEEEFEEAWKAIGLSGTTPDDVKESFKYIIPFSKFI